VYVHTGRQQLAIDTLAVVHRTLGPPAIATVLAILSVFGREPLHSGGDPRHLAGRLDLLHPPLRRDRVRIGPDAPAVPKPVLVAIVLYLIAYAGSTQSIFSGAYVTGQEVRYSMELAGGHVLICSLLLYELVRRRLLGLITARRAFLIMFATFGIAHYAKGGTGLTTGYLTASAVLLLPRTGAARRLSNVMRIGCVMAVVLAISFLSAVRARTV